MTDKNKSQDDDAMDRLEAKEDAREREFLNEQLKKHGLLPAPEATPSDGPAPAG